MYSKNEDEIFKILKSNIDGLDSKETKKRINDHGQNIIINKLLIYQYSFVENLSTLSLI